MTDEGLGEGSFEAHLELLRLFLAHRADIVEKIQGVLNAQRKPAQHLQDRPLLTRQLEDCFFALAAVTDNQSRLRGRLEEAHWASGFRPRQMPELHNDVVAPAEMAMRAFYFWQQTRWPGRSGRVRYAHTLFNLQMIRSFELLSMRLWDAGSSSADDRLAQIQDLLDALWKGMPADQPALVRDARWLIPLAQSPTTDELAAYFEVARHVTETLAQQHRIEVLKAHAQMIGGHLRSQIRHYCQQEGVSIDDKSVVLRTRASNALDFALLIQGLVFLLEAYERARQSGDDRKRLELASALCQAISPDPEVFLNRLDLLGAYSMIEHVFIATDRDGQAHYTSLGQRHVDLVHEYEALIGRAAQPLLDDCQHFRPVAGAYSPYGAIYGTPTNLIEDMALKAAQREAVKRFSLEDVFADGDADGSKLAWISGWRDLPHIDPQVRKLYEYPQRFAVDMFERIDQALHRRVAEGETSGSTGAGRLFAVSEDDSQADAEAAQASDLPVRYIGSSDAQIVADGRAEPYDEAQLLRDREEGHFVVSYRTSGGWVAIKKDILTDVLGAGHDMKIVGLPREAVGVLRLMCPNKVVPAAHQASAPPSILKA